MEHSADGTALMLRAIELVIADVDARDGPERDEQLAQLHALRTRLLADEEPG